MLLLPFRYIDSILFVCNIVMNFQTIRNDFNQQVKEQAEALEAEQMRAHLAEEMERQDRIYSKSRYKELLVFIRLMAVSKLNPMSLFLVC